MGTVVSTEAAVGRSDVGSRPTNADPYKWPFLGVAAATAITLPAMFVLVAIARPTPHPPAWSEQAAAQGVEPHVIASGAHVYQTTCAVCHGPEGDGVHGLGKPVHNSAFVRESSHAELFELLVDGRKIDDPMNTTGALMPPRGARQLDDQQINAVIAYLRAIQDPGVAPVSVEPWDIKSRAGNGGATAIELTGHPGYELFIASCAACHGQGAEGIEGSGLPLITSGYIRGTSDPDLIGFIKRGRPMWDASNTTGLDMPPKGGNPAITDDQLQQIIDYIRALQDEAMGS